MKKLLIISLMVLLAGCSTTQENTEPTTSSMEPPAVSENTSVDEPKTEVQDSPFQEGYNTFDSPEWDEVKAKFQETNQGEYINSFYLPELDGKIYFSSITNEEYDQFSESLLSTVNVYTYDVTSKEIKLFTSLEEDSLEVKLAGTDGESLVFIGNVPDYSPGPCTGLWNNITNTFLKLNIESPNKFETYEVPQTLVDRAQAQQETCSEESRF